MHPKGGRKYGAGPARRESQARGAVQHRKFHEQKYRTGSVSSFPIAGTKDVFSKHVDALSTETELLQAVEALVCFPLSNFFFFFFGHQKHVSAKNECIWANIWSRNTIFIPKYFFFQKAGERIRRGYCTSV